MEQKYSATLCTVQRLNFSKLIKKSAFPNELKTTAMGSWSQYIALLNKLFASRIVRQASAQRNR
jgi:hypothetical protein